MNRHSNEPSPRPRRFIIWRAILGGFLGYACFLPLRIAYEASFNIGSFISLGDYIPNYDLYKNIIRTVCILIGGVLGATSKYSIWWVHQPPKDPEHPGFFSRKGVYSGALIGLTLPILVLVVTTVVQGIVTQDWQHLVLSVVVFGLGAGIVLGFLVGIPVGGISGGISRYLFWYVNSLPDQYIQIGGVILILIGFAVQAVQPILQMLLLTPA